MLKSIISGEVMEIIDKKEKKKQKKNKKKQTKERRRGDASQVERMRAK